MGLIVNLTKDFLNWLKPQQNKKSSNQNVFCMIIVFVGLFFVVAFGGMLAIRLLMRVLNFYGLIGAYTEITWLFYGIILGISFAFFGQSFPSFERKDFSPEILYKSFKHHFKYFVYFIVAVVWWCGLILIILRVSGVIQ